MALTELGEDWQDRKTEFRAEWRRGSFVQERGHTRSWLANTDDLTDSGMVIFLAALAWAGAGGPLAPVWSVHPDDPAAFVTHHTFRHHENDPSWWVIVAHYTTSPHPVTEAPDVEWESASVQVALEGAQAYIDFDGNEHLPTESPYPGLPVGSLYPITNSAGDPPAEPPSDDDFYWILRVRRNFAVPTCGTGTATGGSLVTPAAGFDPYLIERDYARRVNSEPFLVPNVCSEFDTGTVFLASRPRAKLSFRNAITFYETQWEFWVRERGWELRFPDLGYRSNAVEGEPGYSSGEEPIPIFIGGQHAQNPQKLNGVGDIQPIGEPALFLRYRIRKTADFNGLLLFS